MPNTVIERSAGGIIDELEGVRRSLHVSRAFGDPVDLGDVRVIPVARVGGGGGGGAGEGPDESGAAGDDLHPTAGGMGAGFGLGVQPVGVYQVGDGEVTWKPSVDVNRAIRGGQVLAGVIAVCVTLVLLRRSRCGT